MKILVVGGGTGGHIYPAISFINYVRTINKNVKFLFVGNKYSLESIIVPKYNIDFINIRLTGFERKIFSFYNLYSIYLFIKSFFRVKKILNKFKPDVVLGMGSYITSSVILMSFFLKIPTIIHEQNSVPGFTNKILSYFVNNIAVCYKSILKYFPKNKVFLTGNPRNQMIFRKKNKKKKQKKLVIFSGSIGSLIINKIFIKLISIFKKKKYKIIYVSGYKYYNYFIKNKIIKNIKNSNIKIFSYIDNIINLLYDADLVICRAGATSITEIISLGIPAILIPSPNVTNNHQIKNVIKFKNLKAIKIIFENKINKIKLISLIDKMIFNKKLKLEMKKFSKKNTIVNSGKLLYNLIVKLYKKNKQKY